MWCLVDYMPGQRVFIASGTKSANEILDKINRL